MNDRPSVFLSHASLDKETATTLKNNLSQYDIDLFLAHDDIDAGEYWDEALYDEIQNCDIFMVLLSENYHVGTYTDQEIGMGLAHGKNIIPISIDGTKPYGFISSIQSTHIGNIENITDIEKIAELVRKKSGVEVSIIDKTIEGLSQSTSWAEASVRAKQLLLYPKFSKSQIKIIASAYIDNDQIHDSFVASNIIRRILSEHKKLLNNDQLSLLNL